MPYPDRAIRQRSCKGSVAGESESLYGGLAAHRPLLRLAAAKPEEPFFVLREAERQPTAAGINRNPTCVVVQDVGHVSPSVQKQHPARRDGREYAVAKGGVVHVVPRDLDPTSGAHDLVRTPDAHTAIVRRHSKRLPSLKRDGVDRLSVRLQRRLELTRAAHVPQDH